MTGRTALLELSGIPMLHPGDDLAPEGKPRLTLVSADSATGVSGEEGASSQAFKSAKVLVVDDEKWIIDIVRINFEMRGHQVLGCSDSTKALETARAEHPDVIILDLLMPEKNGWEVLEELRADEETLNIPVIICSVMKESQTKDRALRSGAADYLAKPFESEALIAIVEKVLTAD
ncbi:MAG: response regulator transcription factor [Candidatus Geothermincolia bacterium]